MAIFLVEQAKNYRSSSSKEINEMASEEELILSMTESQQFWNFPSAIHLSAMIVCEE